MPYDSELRTSNSQSKIGDSDFYVSQFDINNMDSVLAFYKAVNVEAEKYRANTERQMTLEEALNDIYAERKAEATADFEYLKKQKKLEIEIAQLKTKTDKQSKAALKDLEKRHKLNKEIYEFESKKEKRDKEKAQRDQIAQSGKQMMKEGNLKERFQGYAMWASEGQSGMKGFTTGLVKSFDKLASTLGNLVTKLNTSIEEIARYKSDWDTRLFGSSTSHTSLVESVSKSLGMSPYVKQADVMKNINQAVESGIAFNVEQRAFLQSVKDDIATTFNAFDSTLLQIIRIQQSDSTAARLGMEASLNQFFNSMYSNTEYLNGLSDNVTSALYEATSLLSSEQSVGFEYQVQKWLGSLYSVGMSQGSVSSIAQALGALASGDVNSTSTGAGKLLVMAASRAGMDYSQLLTQGLDESEMNSLMQSMVEYLGEIANSNKVVQTQYAAIYGLHTSDIMSAVNLQSSVKDISKYGLNYNNSLSALNKMASTIGQRQNMAEWLQNAKSNLEYTLASGIASSPALYGIWEMSNMLDELVGGISIPTIMAMGTGVDLETTVADLMKVGSLSVSLLASSGNIISSIGDIAQNQGILPTLNRLGIFNKAGNAVTRGSGLSDTSLSSTVSQSRYVGNTAGGDVQSAALTSAEDQKNELQVKNEEENNTIKLEDINDSIWKIHDLLSSVIAGGAINVSIGSNLPFSPILG